jgi:hypothetical protein
MFNDRTKNIGIEIEIINGDGHLYREGDGGSGCRGRSISASSSTPLPALRGVTRTVDVHMIRDLHLATCRQTNVLALQGGKRRFVINDSKCLAKLIKESETEV